MKKATDACVLASSNASPAQRGPRRDCTTAPRHAAVLFCWECERPPHVFMIMLDIERERGRDVSILARCRDMDMDMGMGMHMDMDMQSFGASSE